MADKWVPRSKQLQLVREGHESLQTQVRWLWAVASISLAAWVIQGLVQIAHLLGY